MNSLMAFMRTKVPLLLCGLLPLTVFGAEFDWNGFAAQGVIRAKDSGFVNDSGDLSAELTELGINARYRLTPAWHLAGQVVYLEGGNRYPAGLRLDYLFLDWSFLNEGLWQGNLYLGRFKNMHWLYSNTRDIPFARPSIVLPQSIYFDAFRDVAVGNDGAALQLTHSNGYGDFKFGWSLGRTPVSYEQGQMFLSRLVQGRVRQDFDHQASFYWQPYLNRFTFGGVLIDSNFSYLSTPMEPLFSGDFRVRRVLLNMRYQLERWEFSSEVQQERLDIDGFFMPAFNHGQIGQGGYVMAQYRYSPELRFFSFVDYSVSNKNDRKGNQLHEMSGGRTPKYFAYQYTFATGLSYNFTTRLSFSAEFHWVEGAARMAQVVIPDIVNNDHQYWQVYSAQLMYRF